MYFTLPFRLDAPFGTEDNPVVVPSEFSERIVGVADPDDDSLVGAGWLLMSRCWCLVGVWTANSRCCWQGIRLLPSSRLLGL